MARITHMLVPALAIAVALCAAPLCGADSATPASPAPVSGGGTSATNRPIIEYDDEDLTLVPIGEEGSSVRDGASASALPRTPLLREGKRLFDREGSIERAHAQCRFTFDDGSMQPIVLLPCRALAVMEELSDYGKRPVVFTISGVVTEYRNRNYLRIVGNPQMATRPPEEPAETKKSATRDSPGSIPAQPVTSESAAPRTDRDVPPAPTDLDIPEPIDVPVPTPAVVSAAPRTASSPGAALREGKRLTDLEGRIVRTNGQTEFIFDSGDPPVLLLPDRKLELMEDLSDYGRRPMRFRISGIVTEYHGRNYLAMTKMVVVPKATEDL